MLMPLNTILRTLLLACCMFVLPVFAISIPEKPTGHVNDYANILDSATKANLETILLRFEEETSNQLVIATFNSLEGQTLEDFSIKLAQKWKIGTKKNDNGVILLVFKNDRQVRIEVGYGLEGALPDITCSQIIRYEIVPAFKEGNYNQGIINGITAIINATKGEYKSSKVQNQDGELEANKLVLSLALMFYLIFPLIAYLICLFLCIQFFGVPLGVIVGLVIVIILVILRQIFFSSVFGQTISGGQNGYFNDSNFFGGGFSGGGFSGGGGSFGGGGASGRW